MEQKINKRLTILLLVVTVLAFAIYYFTSGDLNLTMINKREKNPRDKAENMLYTIENQGLSTNVLERNGIALKNFGDSIRAVELGSGVELDVSNIATRSTSPITSFSEYVSYLYMFDGTTLYRSNLDSTELKAVVKDCSKFIPMGNYIYSLKPYMDDTWLFRCSIVGTYEKLLFDMPVKDFWAHDGNLLMLTEQGRYRWYNVTSEDTLDHLLPDGATNVALDSSGILYIAQHEGDTAVYKRQFTLQTDTTLYKGNVVRFAVGPHHIAMLVEDGGSYKVVVTDPNGGAVTQIGGTGFAADCTLDASASNVYITQMDGTTLYSPLGKSDWKTMFK